MTVIIEANFCDFGRPDAMVVVEAGNGERYLFIVEAKVGTYADSAEDFRTRDKKGFNSTLNGELTLRYRLLAAIQEYQRGGHRLSEPSDLARAYGSAPRRLYKVDNLRNIVEAYLLAIPQNHCFLVALTTDQRNPWEDIAARAPEFLPDVRSPSVDGDGRYEGADWQPEHNEWVAKRDRFGWISFEMARPLLPTAGRFARARHFLVAQAKQRPAQAQGELCQPLPLKNWGECGSTTITLRDEIREFVNRSLDDRPGSLVTGDGSDSVRSSPVGIVLKIMPPTLPSRLSGADVYVAIRRPNDVDWENDIPGFTPLQFRVRGVAFDVIGLTQAQWNDPASHESLSALVAAALDMEGNTP